MLTEDGDSGRGRKMRRKEEKEGKEDGQTGAAAESVVHVETFTHTMVKATA